MTTTSGPGKQATTATGTGDGRRCRRAGVAAHGRRWAALSAMAALAVLAAGSASAAAAPRSQNAAVTSHDPASAARTIARSLTTRELFAEVHRAYRHVPAVELSVLPHRSTFQFPRRFVLVLRSGVVVAEEFVRSGRNAATQVARRHHPTFSRTAGTKCWRRLPSSNPQTLADVGISFPYTRVHIKALPPKRRAFGWTVISENGAAFWFLAFQPQRPAHLLDKSDLRIKRFITYGVFGRSHRLKAIFIQQPSHRPSKDWLRATLQVHALASAPRLPTPAPVC